MYIVGNGFDIAHGLNTGYWELRKYIEERDSYFLRAFEELYDIQPLDDTEPWYTRNAQEKWNKSVNHSLWSAFEKFIGNPNTTEMLEQSISVTEGMPSEGIQYHMDLYWKEQFGFIDKLQDYVKNWIEEIDTSKIVCRNSRLLHSSDIYLNFNYTDVLERIYDIEDVIHIHGGISSVCDIPPILGHCNKQDIQKHRQWAKEAEEDYLEAEASIQNAVADYLESIYKNTRDIILLNSSFFNNLNSVDNIVVIGWSAGDVDIPYLKEIIRNTNSNVKWTVYWYDNDAYNVLASAFQKEGICDKDKIKYIQSNEFWDV